MQYRRLSQRYAGKRKVWKCNFQILIIAIPQAQPAVCGKEETMKKKIIMRCLTGFPLGLAIGYVISIVISLVWAEGYYSPCVPDLIDMAGSEINAVILQAFLCGALGTGFAASSVIWEIENWGIVKQTGIYFLIVSLIMMPIAYITYWMEHSLKGIVSYFGIFALIFAVVWLVQYIRARRNVRDMNASLGRQGNQEK